MEEKPINIRVTLEEGDPVREKFEKIKAELGVVSNTDTVRSLISRFRLKRSV